MASWDDDEFSDEEHQSPATGSKSMEKKLWKDEDAGDDFAAVKDSWDDDDDDVKTGKATAATTASTKAPATKGKSQAKANAKAKAEAADATPSETSTSNAAAEKAQKQSDNGEPIEKFIPKSEKEFAEYAERIAKDLLRPYEKSYHYIGLMKAMNKLAVASLTSTSVKEIASSMTTVANEKLKAEKEADAGKKKPGQKKKRLHVNKAEGRKFRNPDDEDDAGDDERLSS
uniref:Uncharacterized protein n=1 Tax=Oryza punctata TaxID=4537 RepID=A0A0E0L497_ORYPU